MGEASSKAGSAKLHAYYLSYWMRTRGPLFERPRMAALRALAVVEVLALSRVAPERRLRIRAARAMHAHQGDGRPSKNPATKVQFETVRQMCAGLRRVSREAAHLHFARQAKIVTGLLRKYDQKGRDEYDWMMDYAWAEQVCGVLFSRAPGVRLRAAVTLLNWTAPDARKVGYRKLSAEDEETIEEVHRDAGTPGTPWGPPVPGAGNPRAPRVESRARDGP